MTTLDSRVLDFTIRLVLPRGKSIEFDGPTDITQENTDAIVNAANSSLLGGGGVDGAIHRAGGTAILAQCREITARIGSLAAGKAVITGGGNLAAKYVIHTVGPIYHGGARGEPEQLADCHRESIRLADEHALNSISFPAISTGVFGYPVSKAAPIAISACIESLASAQHVSKIRFVLFNNSILKEFVQAAEKLAQFSIASPILIEKAFS